MAPLGKKLISLLLASGYIIAAAAQTPRNAAGVSSSPVNSDESVKLDRHVRSVSFLLRSGQLVTGRILSEDKNQITLSRPDLSRIVVETYNRIEIHPATLNFQLMTELDYCLQMAERFASQTGDFQDDTDDFIQASRFYQKALQFSHDAFGDDHQRTRAIQDKIDRLQADRQRWVQEVANRAELKRMEFEATFEQRLNALEKKIDQNANAVAEMNQGIQVMQQTVMNLNSDVAREVQWLKNENVRTQQIINDWDYRRRYRYSNDLWDYPRIYIQKTTPPAVKSGSANQKP